MLASGAGGRHEQRADARASKRALSAAADDKEPTPRQKRQSLGEGAIPLAAEGLVPTVKDGWMDLRRREGGAAATFTPVFVHCAGYLLAWYKEKPLHGEKASAMRVIDLRDLQLLDIGEGLLLRLKTSDAMVELRATSEADGAQWLAHLASCVPPAALCEEAGRMRDATLVAALASEYASQPPPAHHATSRY